MRVHTCIVSFRQRWVIEKTGLFLLGLNGKRLARPAAAAVHTDMVHKLTRAGLSKSEIACRLNIRRTSVRRIVDEGT
jgi:DNA invertase Pin-like site-specific DNA recombinase